MHLTWIKQSHAIIIISVYVFGGVVQRREDVQPLGQIQNVVLSL